MTKKSLLKWFAVASVVYFIAIGIGVLIRIYDSTDNGIVYETYKDMIPFIIAIPVSWLGFCLQRRFSYLQQLRVLWSTLINAIQKANSYTYVTNPTCEQFCATLSCLSASIEEIRGVFKNIEETEEDIGLYPFEPIKDIFGLINDMGYKKQLSEAERENIRN